MGKPENEFDEDRICAVKDDQLINMEIVRIVSSLSSSSSKVEGVLLRVGPKTRTTRSRGRGFEKSRFSSGTCANSKGQSSPLDEWQRRDVVAW